MKSHRVPFLNQLRNSVEPSIRYSTLLYIDNEDPTVPKMRKLQEEIRNSPRVTSLIDNVEEGVYKKWQGSHWVLSLLAELNYPPNDDLLHPLREKVYDWLFSSRHLKSIKTIKRKVRRCASQEGNAIYYLYKLGLFDDRTDLLVNRLLEFQWEDGGWNCDKNPKAHHSSYHESLIPLRALIIYQKTEKKSTRSKSVSFQKTVDQSAELFLKRELYISASTGESIHHNFTLLHFPYYWRYNILFALKVLNEGGYLGDPRCQRALNLIESKELSTGGFLAEKKYYYGAKAASGKSVVNWGRMSKTKANEWVTSEVYNILNSAGRL